MCSTATTCSGGQRGGGSQEHGNGPGLSHSHHHRNYTISQLPVGTYDITVQMAGFKTYSHTNLGLGAAESVTVNEAASLLSAESADVAHNITVNPLDSLPILGIGTASARASGIRNPFRLLQLIPGSAFDGPNRIMVIKGTANNSEAVRIEGQDARNNTPAMGSLTVPVMVPLPAWPNAYNLGGRRKRCAGGRPDRNPQAAHLGL